MRTRPKPAIADFTAYPVSILKPLKGIDEGLRENLESFFRLDYPAYELVFSVGDAGDPALPLARELIALRPEVPARLYVGAEDAGPNPKVNNLLAGYAAAAHDLILISDSNVRVRPDYLKRMVESSAEPGVGIVTSLVAGVSPKGWGGILEATFLNAYFARGMTLAFFAGKPCVVGKSMLFSRASAARFGGLRILGRFLHEDYMAGEAMQQLGLRVALAQEPVEQHLGRYTVGQFWSRHLRWGRIRKAQAPLIFPLELFQNSLCVGAVGALALPDLLGVATHWFLAAHLAAWAACDLWLASRVARARPSLLALAHWLLREAVTVPLYFQILSNNKVNWRGKELRLGVGGMIE